MRNQQIIGSTVKGSYTTKGDCVGSLIYKVNLEARMQQLVKANRKARMIQLCVRAVIAVSVLAILTFGITKAISSADSLEKKVSWVQVQVEQGQTLWSIVSDHQLNSKVDVRELVYIARSHHNDSVVLHAGETIDVPVVK